MKFIENILATILQLEKTFFDLAKGDSCNVIVVCDRGAMDPSACELEGRAHIHTYSRTCMYANTHTQSALTSVGRRP